jgi:adenine-specific DNA methylase
MTQERKKTLGAYYTPEALCEFLCRWAIQHPNDHVLEPSFGSGNILDAAYVTLEELGNTNPRRQLYGCDIDGTACTQVTKKGYIKSHLINKDFLSTSPNEFTISKFETVIANPPYVSIRGISKHQVSKGKEIADKWNFAIDGKSSLWAYFIIHSLNFLKEKGRMAWVLPKNFLYADYAKSLQIFLTNYFEKIEVHDIEENLFVQEGTSERVVVLLCSGFSKTSEVKSSIVARRFYRTLDDFISNSTITESNKQTALTETAHTNAIKIGELADIKIGIVTGASKYVIFSPKAAKELGINSKYLLPIFTKSSNHNTLILKNSALENPKGKNNKTRILDISKWRKDDYPSYSKFYNNIPYEVRHNTAGLGKEVWYSVANSSHSSEPVCDAFLVPLSQGFSRLIVNEAKVDCTNSLYRVFLKTSQLFEQHDKEYLISLLCLSFYNSFTRLSIIRNARLHGKALKLEPSNFKRVSIFSLQTSVDSLKQLLDTVNSMVEKNAEDSTIINLVDEFFTKESSGEYQKESYKSQLIEAMKNYGR